MFHLRLAQGNIEVLNMTNLFNMQVGDEGLAHKPILLLVFLVRLTDQGHLTDRTDLVGR